MNSVICGGILLMLLTKVAVVVVIGGTTEADEMLWMLATMTAIGQIDKLKNTKGGDK